MHARRIASFVQLANGSGPVADRIRGCDRLVREGEFELARPALEELRNDPDVGGDARRLISASRQLERWGIVGKLQTYRANEDGPSGAPGFEVVDFEKEAGALVSRRPGARSVLFVFTGHAKMFWVSLHVLHQIVEQFDCNVVYLRDYAGFAHLLGIGGFGSDYDSSIAAMRRLVEDLGASRTYVLGSSGGGFVAMRAAFDLGAEAALLFSPMTECDLLIHYLSMHEAGAMAKIWKGFDLRTLYHNDKAPPVSVIFGEANAADTISASRLKGLPTVTLLPVAGYERHDVLAHTLANGSFRTLLEGLLATGAPVRAAAASHSD